jgi:hypothetical protein
MKPEARYESSENELSNTGFLGRAGQRRYEGGQDDRALLDQIYRSQHNIREVLHYNIESNRGLADRMSRVEGLLQQLVDLQISNLRPMSRQSEGRTPMVQQAPEPEADDDDENSVLSYIDEPELAAAREQPRAHFANQSLRLEEAMPQIDDNEMAVLVSLKKLRMKQQSCAGRAGDFVYTQGREEMDLNYEVRMGRSAHAALMAELRAGVTTASLYRELVPHDGPARVTNPPARRPYSTGSNAIPLPPRQRQSNMAELGHSPTVQDIEDGADNNSQGESPGIGHMDRHKTYPGLRPSFSISTIMRRPSVMPAQPFADQTLERTDELVRNKVRNAAAAQFDWPGDVNISKLGLKLTPPDYSGGDTIDELLRFVKELMNYFLIYNLMKEDLDRLRVAVLGTLLKGKAQKWYQHAIDNNADGSWTFEEALVALKRYFVKDASSWDAASKFERFIQKDRSVMELKRELERLSKQMVQPPSKYHMARRFLLALNIEIQSAVIRFGFNPKNHDLETIYKVARQVESSQTYKRWDDIQKRRRSSKEPKDKGSQKTSQPPFKRGTSSATKPSSSFKPSGTGASRGGSGSASHIECFNCKQRGHYSSNCPKQSSRCKSIAYAKVTTDELDVKLVNTVEEDGLAFEEHQSPTDGQDRGMEFPHYEDSDGEPEEDVWSLNDWCGHVGADGESDKEEERVALVWSSAICLLPEDECPIAESLKVSKLDDSQVAYRLRGTKDLGQLQVEDGPRRDFKSLGIIEGYMQINGHKAPVLLDSGSTIDMISANFASIHKLDLFQLKKPVKLQMATSGSRSVINFGAKAEIECGDFSQTCYFDVVNLDRYQVVLGTPFLKQLNVILNYAGSGSFKLGDRWFPVREGEFVRPLSKVGGSSGINAQCSISQSMKPPLEIAKSLKGARV